MTPDTERLTTRFGGVYVERKVSLTGLLAILMAFTAMVGGWYRFDSRQTQDEISISYLQKNQEKDGDSRESLKQAINDLNTTIGKITQRLDDEDNQRTGAWSDTGKAPKTKPAQ